MLMYTRTYHLDRSKYIADVSQIKKALMSLKGVEEVFIPDASHTITVTFDEHLSEKQVLSTINQCKSKQKGMH